MNTEILCFTTVVGNSLPSPHKAVFTVSRAPRGVHEHGVCGGLFSKTVLPSRVSEGRYM